MSTLLNASLCICQDVTHQPIERTRNLMEACAAAVIHGGASVVLTVNLRDFPAAALSS
jgi:putative N-acetylmannosamine-6-phosphate epimerase